MDDKEIYELFLSVAEHSGQTDDATREVFSALVRSTLRYRDHLLESKGITVTVQDVRIALEWLVPSLKTGRLPDTDDKIKLDLLKIWLDELRTLGHHQVYLS
jgi:hypothetical protein